MPALPTFIQIEPVGQCNLRCQMCAIQFRTDGPPHGPPAFMSFETFTRLIDEFGAIEQLHLQGLGEPMMHPRFFDMVSYATARGIRVTTNSNMSLLNARRAERCVASGLDCLHTSIDGAQATTYERIRARGRFERVIKNVELLLETRERLGSRLPHLKLVVVVMRQNLHELPELVRLAHRLQMEEIWVQHLSHDFGEESLPAQYQPMRAFVDSQTLLTENPERIEQFFGAARCVAQELDIKLRLPRTQPRPHPPGVPGLKRCDWPWRRAYISYQGFAMPCCMVSTPDRMNFGSMAERGVAAVWDSDAFQSFRDQLNSDEPPELCRSCAVYNGTF
jgi:MoaA/NifB/PqqE/SkfB family radical SAM enzyme